MTLDDFVIERNLVSYLQTNEVDSRREEYNRLQIGEGGVAAGEPLPPLE